MEKEITYQDFLNNLIKVCLENTNTPTNAQNIFWAKSEALKIKIRSYKKALKEQSMPVALLFERSIERMEQEQKMLKALLTK